MQSKKKWNWFRISRTLANAFMGLLVLIMLLTSWGIAAFFGVWMLLYNIAASKASKERRMMMAILSDAVDNAQQIETHAAPKCTPVPYRPQQPENTYKNDAYVYNHVDLCIISDQPKPDLRRVKVGDYLNLVQEPENPYDHRAVRVETLSGRKLGYMYRGKLQDMANDFIDRGDEITVTVDWVSSDALTFSVVFVRQEP